MKGKIAAVALSMLLATSATARTFTYQCEPDIGRGHKPGPLYTVIVDSGENVIKWKGKENQIMPDQTNECMKSNGWVVNEYGSFCNITVDVAIFTHHAGARNESNDQCTLKETK